MKLILSIKLKVDILENTKDVHASGDYDLDCGTGVMVPTGNAQYFFTGVIIIIAMVLCVIVPYLTIPLVSRSIVTYWSSYAVLNAQYVDAMQG